MRVGLCVEGTRGDVSPMLQLADRLRARGHEVAFACPPGFREVLERRGMRFCAATADVHGFIQREASNVAAGGLRAGIVFDRFMRSSLPTQLEACRRLASESDVLIAAGAQLAGATAAELYGIPYRYLFYCPALVPSPLHAPFMAPWQSLPRWANRWLWKLLLPPFRFSIGRGLDRARRELGLPPVGDTYRHLISDAPILAADRAIADLSEHELPHGVELRCIAALHPGGAEARAQALPDKVEQFLAAGDAPVFIGFGSMPDPNPTATSAALLAAIEANGARAILSSGWAGLGDIALPDGVLRVGSLPHAALFPRCAAVVHHGGAGTTTAAARAGIPQIVVPHIVDQFYWAQCMFARGVAPKPLPRTKLDATTLGERLDAVLDNEWMQERARELGQRLDRDWLEADPPECVLDGIEN